MADSLVEIYNPTITTTLQRDRANNDYVCLPCPSEYSGSSSTLVNSARNVKGVVIGEVIASDIAKVEITWNYLTRTQYSEIAKLFERLYGGSFFVKVKFFDSVKNDWNEKIMYPNDRSFHTAKIKLVNGMPVGYTNVSLHLIDTGKEVQ